MPRSPERAVEIRIAEHLARALQTLVRQERGLTNDDVLAGSAEFLTRVCVMAFMAEREQGGGPVAYGQKTAVRLLLVS